MFYEIKIRDNAIVETAIFKKGSGFYKVFKDNGGDLVYFNNNNKLWFFIEPLENIPLEVLDLFKKTEVKEDEPELKSIGSVSEDFALKMLSISMNKEKFKDLK